MGETAEQKEIKVSAVIEYGASSVQTQYQMSEKVIRVMVWGSLSFTQIILDSIAALSGNHEG